MAKVRLWMDDGVTLSYDGNVNMDPEERTITICDDENGVIAEVTYAQVIEIKIDLLDED